MVANPIGPVHILNRYTYDVLLGNGAIGSRLEDYNGRTPIIPSQQIPEFTVRDKPFLVYGYAINPSVDLHVLKSGTLTYAVYDTNDHKINEILNVLEEVYGRFDETAADVAAYRYKGITKLGAFMGITFYSISVGLIEGPSPATEEGGRQAGIIMIRFIYSVDRDIDTIPIVS